MAVIRRAGDVFGGGEQRMIRMLILRLVLLAVPFLIYAAWRWWDLRRRGETGRIWAQTPTLWLFVVGVALVVLSVLIPGLLVPGGTFVQ